MHFDSIFEGTIIDGDLTKIPGTDNYCFVVFDCLMSCGNVTSKLRYDQRLEIAREILYRLATFNLSFEIEMANQLTPINLGLSSETKSYQLPIFDETRAQVSKNMFKVGKIPFFLTVKPIFELGGIRKFERDIIHNQKFDFPTDGYILTSTYLPATPFRCNKNCVFKWKPKGSVYNENTIDVMVTMNQKINSFDNTDLCELQNFSKDKRFNYSNYQQIHGNVCMWGTHNKHSILFGTLVCDEKEINTLDFGKIYECIWNHVCGRWEIMRKRSKYPNSMETIVATIQNIIEDVILEDIEECEI
jgi:hypothetical protein